MARNTCPSCGAVTADPAQKYCTQCGTKLPDLPGPAGIRTSVPAWAIVAAAIIVVLVLAVILLQPLAGVFFGTAAGEYASPAPGSTMAAPDRIAPLPSTSLPTTVPYQAPAATAATAPPTPVPTTTVVTTVTTTATTPVTTATTVPTSVPTPEFTAQITLAVTRIPSQPPSETFTSKTEGAPYIDPSSLETRIHQLINVQRQQSGLSTLSYDSFLSDIARGHSYDMSLRNFFEHTNPDGMDARARGEWAGYPCVRDYETYYTEGISENIAMVYRYDTYKNLIAPNGTVMETVYYWNTEEYIANKVVTGWMNSEGHRNNILDFHFQQEGIGVAFAPDNAIYITENFC